MSSVYSVVKILPTLGKYLRRHAMAFQALEKPLRCRLLQEKK